MAFKSVIPPHGKNIVIPAKDGL